MELTTGIKHKERKNKRKNIAENVKLRSLFFRDVSLCHCVIGHRHFEVTCWAYLKGWMVQSLGCLKTLGTSYTVMWCHIPEAETPNTLL